MVLSRVAGGYAAFLGLGIISRFVPLVFVVMVLIGIVVPVALARRRGSPLGYTRRNLGKSVLSGVAIGALMAVLTVALYGWSPPPLLGVQLLIGLVLWPLVLSPFQENVFRGWMQPRLQEVLGRTPALLVTSTAFALWHLAPPLSGTATSTISFAAPVALAMAFVLGLLTGWTRQTTDSMIAPWLGHALAGLAIVAVGKMAFLQYTP